jgi:hypothetical protein
MLQAYCGTCVANRAPVKGKGKAKVTDDNPLPLAFSTCVVLGCKKKKLTKNDFIHVYISS